MGGILQCARNENVYYNVDEFFRYDSAINPNAELMMENIYLSHNNGIHIIIRVDINTLNNARILKPRRTIYCIIQQYGCAH